MTNFIPPDNDPWAEEARKSANPWPSAYDAPHPRPLIRDIKQQFQNAREQLKLTLHYPGRRKD